MGVKWALLLWLLVVFGNACGSEDRSSPFHAPTARSSFIRAQMSGASPAYRWRAQMTAHNPAQGFSARIDGDRMQLASDRYTFSCRWTGVGRGDARVAPPAAHAEQALDQRLSRARGDSEEWYLNGPLGLEQGFVLATPPTGHGPLVLEVAFAGVSPRSDTADAVVLHDDTGHAVAHYSDLVAYDARGVSLPASMRVVGAAVELHIDDTAARYPVTVDPLIWIEVGHLRASDFGDEDQLGFSVAMSGDTIVVGAIQDVSGNQGPGAAYVFTWDGADWTEQAKLTADDGAAFDHFGFAVSISLDTIVVGAPEHAFATLGGAAYVFVRSGTTWTQEAKLLPATTQSGGYFAERVSLDGDTVLIGSRGNSFKTAYIFTRSGTVWTEAAELLPSDTTEGYASSVSLDGNTALVGAFDDDDVLDNAGAVYVFTGGGTAWAQQAKLTSSQTSTDALMGTSVSVSGDTAWLGAPGQRAGDKTGAVYVFRRNGVTWTQEARLFASDAADGDELGRWVHVDGDVGIAGAPFHDSGGASSGAAYIFTRSGGLWPEQRQLVAVDAEVGDVFGLSVALSGDTAVVGAPLDGADDSGSAWVFRYVSTGNVCVDASECGTGFCVDGVCCNEACGEGDLDDCQACTEALTGELDGVCGVALDGIPCADDGIFCNGPESCLAGVCVNSGDPCAPAAGDGDADCADVCDESSSSCSAFEPDDAPCDDGLFCTTGDRCTAGVCGGTDPCVASGDEDEDCRESCDEAADSCTAPDPDGVTCINGGVCVAGACRAPLGHACEDDATCISGFCTDGVCCAADTCGAFRCGPTGDCVSRCTDTSACQPGHQCSAAGRCEPIQDVAVDRGCACTLVGGGAAAPLSWLTALLVAGATRRRRRS